MDNSLMGLIGGFIAVAIMLGIGTLILGGASTDCTTVNNFNDTVVVEPELGNMTTGVTYFDDGTTQYGIQTDGWVLQCISNNTQSQAGYGLLIIVLIVLAAVVVLTVVRMLS